MYRIHDPKFHVDQNTIDRPRFHAFQTFLVETPISLPLEDHYAQSFKDAWRFDGPRARYKGIYFYHFAFHFVKSLRKYVPLPDEKTTSISWYTLLQRCFKNWFHSRCKIYSSETKRIAPKIHRISNILVAKNTVYRIISIFRTISQLRKDLSSVHISSKNPI